MWGIGSALAAAGGSGTAGELALVGSLAQHGRLGAGQRGHGGKDVGAAMTCSLEGGQRAQVHLAILGLPGGRKVLHAWAVCRHLKRVYDGI